MRLTIPALALTVLTACLEPLELVAEAPNACLVTSDVSLVKEPVSELPTLPQPLPSPSTTVTRRLEYPVDLALLSDDPAATRILLKSVSLTANGGDLDFVQKVKLSVAETPEPDAGLVTVVEHERKAGDGPELVLQPAEPFDLSPYVREDRVAFEVAVTGSIPTEAASVDVRACFGVETTLSAGG